MGGIHFQHITTNENGNVTSKMTEKEEPPKIIDCTASVLEESFSFEKYQIHFKVPHQIASNHISYAARRRQENKQRLPEFGPEREVLLKIPDGAPGCYFKRFSSDGRLLFAFGGESRFFVYPVKYCGKFDDQDGQCVPDNFTDFFGGEAIAIDVASAPMGKGRIATLLCRDFCLTVKDPMKNRDAFVILASSCVSGVFEVQDKPPQTILTQGSQCPSSIRILNDSHTAFPCLDHVTFFLVSLDSMKVVDFISFKYDYIYLAHHLGVGLNENVNRETMFSVLSMKNQRIFLFEIDFEKKSFRPARQVARNSPRTDYLDRSLEYCNESVVNLISDQLPVEDALQDDSWGRPEIGGIVLKLIKYLLRELNSPCPPLESLLENLHIWKHQLLPDGRILMRLAPSSIILSTNPRHQSAVHALDPLPGVNQNSFIVLYDPEEECVEAVMNSADIKLTEWLKGHWNRIRGVSGDFEGYETIVSLLEKFFNLNQKQSSNALNRRLVNSIPLSPQQLTTSPLLDPTIFRWDTRLTSALARQTPLSCTFFSNTELLINATGLQSANYGADPVRFFSRARPGMLSHTFQFIDSQQDFEALTSANTNSTGNLDKHRWCNVLMHPNLPLMLVYQYGLFRSLSLRVFYN